MLASLGFAGCAAGIHQEQRIFRQHFFRLNPCAVKILNFIVYKIIASCNHGGLGRAFARVPLPDQNFINHLSVCRRDFNCLIGIDLVV